MVRIFGLLGTNSEEFQPNINRALFVSVWGDPQEGDQVLQTSEIPNYSKMPVR